MKIAYDHQIFSVQQYGGISRYFFETTNNIAQCLVHDVRIVTPMYVNAYLKATRPSLKVDGILVPKLRNTSRIIRSVNEFIARPMLACFAPDIVHETYYSRNRVAPSEAKVVLTVYDMIHERFPNYFSIGDKLASVKAEAIKRADHLICISENTRRDVVEMLNVDPIKTSVVHLGFSLTKHSAAPAETIRPFLLYVGTRGGYKNFDALLQAYAMSRELMSSYDILAFGGGGWSVTELERARELGIDVGRLRNVQGDDALLASLYSAASLFIYPSLYEGFGIPPLGAMSFGCPVIASNTSSLPEVVGDAAELINPIFPAEILTAIFRILNDRLYRGILTERGYIRIESFSWKRCAEQTLEVYERVLA